MKRKAAIIAIIAAVVVAAVIIIITNSKVASEPTQTATSSVTTNQTTTMESTTLPDGLQITDLVVGTGTQAMAGDTVSVDYVGTLTNGKQFDSTAAHGGQPFSFVLGAGQVIRGWDEGVVGMRVGGERKLVIPPSLGYGSQSVGNGLIPANSTLIFTVKLLAVQP
jgi:FKBP-type peptidyl-prolyl cis-trans isomerase